MLTMAVLIQYTTIYSTDCDETLVLTYFIDYFIEQTDNTDLDITYKS